jgi:hypothetical protein
MFVDIPNNRIAATLLYGSLVGVRGNNVANSITVSRNGIPNLMLGRKGYRLTRPTQCSVEQRVVGPTPTPSPMPTSTFSPAPTPFPTSEPGADSPATPIPTAQPTYPIPKSDSNDAQLLSLGLRGTSSGKLRTGAPVVLTVRTSKAMSVPLSISLDGVRCSQSLSVSAVGGYHEFTTTMPALSQRVRRLTVESNNVRAVARVSGGGSSRRAKLGRACATVTRAFQRM